VCWFFGETVVADQWGDDGEATTRRRELAALPSRRIGDSGDTYAVDGNDLLIQIAQSGENETLSSLTRSVVPPGNWEIMLHYRYLRSLDALWRRAL
jgi:hypothetical protein